MKSEEQRIFENHLMTETDQLITSFSRIRYAAMCEEEMSPLCREIANTSGKLEGMYT